WERVRRGEFLWDLVWPLGGVVAGFVAVWLWRRHLRRKRALHTPRADTLYTRLLALLSRLGLRPAPAQTPREFAVQANETLAQRGTASELAEVRGRLVDLYYRARFGDRPPAAAELRKMDGELRALAGALRG